MIKLERYSVMNIENAMRGARNPMNSWGKSDSFYCTEDKCNNCDFCPDDVEDECQYFNSVEDGQYILGENDLDLGKRLCNAGSDHRKFLRQIFVSVDITAPLYWWKEFDTYKVGTTANSTSTMHKIHSKEFTLDDFSYDRMHYADNGFIANSKGELWTDARVTLETIIGTLNAYRDAFNSTKDKDYWYSMIQLLPSSYNQMRTCTMTYENLRNMYHSRKNHKLDEWKEFCKWVESLPYAKDFII